MSYRTLVLHLDDQPHAPACTDHAARLAREFDARLFGLCCHPVPPWPGDGAQAFLAGDPITAELRAAQEAARLRELEFAVRCERAGLSSFATLREEAGPLSALTTHALAADLVVMGQADPAGDDAAARAALVHDMLQHSPRAVLVLPYVGRHAALPQRVLVAWDDSPGAARAAAAALPLLRRAHAVDLLRLQPPQASDDREGLDRAAAWLARHGVQARPRLRAHAMPVGEALLNEVADLGAELLVMGAWGRRRIVERVLGGSTRTIAACMTAPVLFCH